MYPRFIINNALICDNLWKGIRFLRIDGNGLVNKVMDGKEEILESVTEKHINLFIEQGVWKEIKEEEAALL